MHASVQVAIRRFAAATNLSIPGRGFDAPPGPLADVLRAMGGRIRDDGVAFADTPQPGRITVTPTAVHAPDGSVLNGPHTPASARIAWARTHMPLTSRPIDGVAGLRIGLALVLEPKTAVLALRLAEAGADVRVYGHPDETRPEVAAALRDAGIPVHTGPPGEHSRPAAPPEAARDFLSQRLHLLVDDGAHLIRWAHAVDGALEEMIGASEETTSGITRLRAAGRELRIPVIAANDARAKTLFDNAYGTGQSCLTTILDLLDPDAMGWPLWQARVAVAGYGDVGRGFAKLTAALGGTVAVADPDPVRLLQARMDGHNVCDLTALARDADLLVSASGATDTVSLEVLHALPDGAAIAVAGGVDQEVATAHAEATGAIWRPFSPAVENLIFPDGRHVQVLDRGGCVNCTAGEGNPIEIMDLSFGVQLAAVAHLLHDPLPPGLHRLPREADDAVAAAALAAWR